MSSATPLNINHNTYNCNNTVTVVHRCQVKDMH